MKETCRIRNFEVLSRWAADFELPFTKCIIGSLSLLTHNALVCLCILFSLHVFSTSIWVMLDPSQCLVVPRWRHFGCSFPFTLNNLGRICLKDLCTETNINIPCWNSETHRWFCWKAQNNATTANSQLQCTKNNPIHVNHTIMYQNISDSYVCSQVCSKFYTPNVCGKPMFNSVKPSVICGSWRLFWNQPQSLLIGQSQEIHDDVDQASNGTPSLKLQSCWMLFSLNFDYKKW